MQLNTNDRDALLRLAERATEVAAWAEPRDPWERSRIEAALQELAEELPEADALVVAAAHAPGLRGWLIRRLAGV